MTRGNAIKMVIALLCLGGSAAAIYNVNSDIGVLQEEAETLACGATGCARLLGLQRQPTSQTFTFQVQENAAQTRIVECNRMFLLFGTYECRTLN